MEEKKTGSKFGVGFLAGFMACLLIVGINFGIYKVVTFLTAGSQLVSTESVSGDSDSTGKLAYIVSLIKTYYYQDVDDNDLIDGIYSGVVESLGDPYSAYYDPQEYEDLMISITGEFAGIGATLQKNPDTGYVTIVKVHKGSPAEKIGLMVDDIILMADDVDLTELDLDVAVTYIRGEKGTDVTLKVLRGGQEMTFTATRDTVTMDTVEYEMLEDNIGYVQISSFQDATARDFIAAMEDLQAQGMESVIFDLRSNTGGLLDSVTEILDYILPEGTTVYMEDKNGKRTTYTSDAKQYIDMPIVVLVDGYTASASEIFTGAIRDYHYGTIVGTKTFGKGIVQSTMEVGDGSAVKLTIASYYTPSGECIHGEGIAPDIELEYEFLGGENDTYAKELDNQIQKAIELLK